MTKVITILILLSSHFLSSAYAYDWDKCRRSLMKQGRDAGLYGGVATVTIFPSQFISSWGACSAVGKPENDRKAFYNDNFESLKINFSENRGEYLKAFVSFYKCSIDGEDNFVKLIRNNYKAVFGKIYNKNDLDLMYPDNRNRNRENWREDWDVTPKASFENLQALVEKNEFLIKQCQIIKP